MATSSLTPDNPCKDCGYNLGITFEEVSNLNPQEPRCPECGSIVKELIAEMSQSNRRFTRTPLVPPGEFGSGEDRIAINATFYCDNYTTIDLPDGYLVSDIASYDVGTSSLTVYYTDGTRSSHEASTPDSYDTTTERIYTIDGDEIHEQHC